MASTATEYSTPDQGLPNGTSLCEGQFTITRRLSAGGFGITYLAEDNTLGRTIVIKECFPDDVCYREDNKVMVRNAAQVKQFRSIVEMFMREARSLAKLRHPNVVGVHRAFEANETAYMALDLIDGHDLLDIIEVKPEAIPSPTRAKEMLIELLHAIDNIHELDLLHRDIAPDNIIIDSSGTPVLIDFGAARGDASRRTRAISSMLVVKDGYSPQEFYMAGSIQTPSSDLYALAATFYHLLTGKAPPNSQIRMAEVAGQNPDPCEPLVGRIEGYEPAFLEAIDTAMQIVPRNRLQSASEWINLIKGDAQARPSSPAVTDSPASEDNPDIDRILTRLVEETNEELEKSKPIVVEQKAAAEPAPAPEPEKPEWLEEFNAESIRKDREESKILEAAAELEALVPDVTFEPVSERLVKRIDIPESVAATHIRKAKTRIIAAPAQPQFGQNQWQSKELEKKERERAEYEEELRVMNEQFRAGVRPKTKAHVGLASSVDEPLTAPQMIGPLAKYLITGVVIGLGLILIYPAFL